MVVKNKPAAAAVETSQSTCFGRFMITIPPEAEVAGLSADYLFASIISERVEIGERGFAERMKSREVQIREIGGKDGFQFVSTLGGTSRNSRIFKLHRQLITRAAFGFEAYKYENSVLFSIGQYGYEPQTIDSVLDRVQKRILQGLRVRGPNEIPTEPGLCLEAGFIASDGSEKGAESSQLILNFNKWPDLYVSVSTTKISKAEPSLLERLQSAKVPEVFLSLIGQIKTLRRGAHDVGPIKGEESLDMLPTDEGYKVHAFRWESKFKLGDPFQPMIVVELNTGYAGRRQRPTISNKEAVEVFDAIVDSIRLRPTGPAKRSEATPIPKAPLGEMATTGRQCPQTGRWQAEEGEERLIREGEVMPHTPVSGTASLWQKLRGEAAPTYRSATVWKLVAYETPTDDTPLDGQGHTG